MFRRMFLSVGAIAAAVAGLTLSPSSADAHPPEVVPVYRPAFYPAHEHHHHHHALFGVRLYVPPPAPIVVARPVCPAPVVVLPAPVCRPTPVLYPR